jgi:adenylate kinase family enzyme
MRRVVILGPGGAGKSTFAATLARATGLPLVELDSLFWDQDSRPKSPDSWAAFQNDLVSKPTWILDGDLGPHDVLEPRLRAADTVVVLDVSRWLCAWRASRRSRERLDFWRWLWTWRRNYRPLLMACIAQYAAGAEIHVPRTSRAVHRLGEELSRAAAGYS